MDDLLKDFVQAAMTDNGKEINDCTKKILYQFSLQVSDAICPLNAVTAPFITNILRTYAKAVASMFPESENISDELDSVFSTLSTQTIVIPMKGRDRS